MKLLNKSILYFILVSVPVLIIAGIASYDMISGAVDETTREIMWSDLEKVKKQVDKLEHPQELTLGIDQLSSVKPDSSGNTGFKFSERILMNAKENEPVKQKVLRSYYKSGNSNYLITIVRPALEEDDLIENLIRTLALIIGLLIIAFFTVNLFLSKLLWKPYYNTINALNKFDLVGGVSFKKEATSTIEFKNLNNTLAELTQKMQSDFALQKEFTENAAHEMQTPLAVMKSKVEQLMQSPKLEQKELEILQGIENSINKLAALNRSLLLLAKIENGQFKEAEHINVRERVGHLLKMWEDFITEKSLNLKVEIGADAKVLMHVVLFDSLINNLIQNAIRYNIKSGDLNIIFENNCLIISNSGPALKTSPEEMYMRFKKGDTSPESTGLGLAIVKSIVDSYNYRINYSYKDGKNTFIIGF